MSTQLMTLKRDRLLQVERSAATAADTAERGAYAPGSYDLYLHLNRKTLDSLFAGFDETRFDIVASRRPLEITIHSVRMDFRPGAPVVTVKASGRDKRTGVVAKLEMDTRLLLEGDPAQPDTMTLRVVATRIVPDLRWRGIDVTRFQIAQTFLALEASKLTEKLPRVTLPLTKNFAMASPAAVRTVTLGTGNGSSITGNVTSPAFGVSGRIVAPHVVFLRNGIHIFANVEGI